MSRKLSFILVAAMVAFLPSVTNAQEYPDFDTKWIEAQGTPIGLRSMPSMSMAPTVITGDRVIIVKPNRDLRRGDVVLFQHPAAKSERAMLKRLIGLSGDTVQIKGGRLYINDAAVGRTFVRKVNYLDVEIPTRSIAAIEYSEQLPGEEQPHLIHEFSDSDALDETPRFIVPEGKLFFMGDNRDNSEDSRAPSGHRAMAMQFPELWPFRGAGLPSDPHDDAIGFVPIGNVMGRAVTVALSLNSCTAAKAEAIGAECLKPQINKGM